jgi:hypothetical protein
MLRHIYTNLFDKYIYVSKKLENKNYLVDHSWVMFSEDSSEKLTVIFSRNGKLTISNNGNVLREVKNWELLNENTMQIDFSYGSYIYKKIFLDDYFMVLQKDNSFEKLILINENKTKNKIIYSLDEIKKHLYNIYEVPKLRQIETQKREKHYQEIRRKESIEFNKKLPGYIFLGLYLFLAVAVSIYYYNNYIYQYINDPEYYALLQEIDIDVRINNFRVVVIFVFLAFIPYFIFVDGIYGLRKKK